MMPLATLLLLFGAVLPTDVLIRAPAAGAVIAQQVRDLAERRYTSTTTSGDGKPWTTAYGAMGEVAWVTTAAGSVFTYGYNPDRSLASIAAPGIAQSFTYDGRGRPTQRQRGSLGWTTDWSTPNQPVTTDGANYTQTVLYDGRGRPASKSFTGAAGLTSVAMAYDGWNRPISATETCSGCVNPVTTTYTYDPAAPWLTGVSRSSSSQASEPWLQGDTSTQVSYGGYTGYGAPRSVTSPGGTVNYAYDSRARIAKVNDAQLTWSGAYLREINGGGLDEVWDYSAAGWVKSVSAAGASGAVYTSYSYDGRGNRTTQTDINNATTSYVYDADDHLTGVQYPDGHATQYLLNGSGMRLSDWDLAISGGTLTTPTSEPSPQATTRFWKYTLDTAGVLQKITDQRAATPVDYPVTADKAGRVLSMQMPNGSPQAFTWDAAGRLAQVTSPGPAGSTQQTQYAYDYQNWRTSEFTSFTAQPPGAAAPPPARAKRFVWGAAELEAETLSNTGTWAAYASANGLVMYAGSQRLAHDALGSIVGRTTSGVLQTSTLDAWGSYTSGAPQFGDASVGYAGQHWDADSGLSYAQQRWYAPGIGRFLSEDPVGVNPQRLVSGSELDGFGYAGGNPVMRVDPGGRAHYVPSKWAFVPNDDEPELAMLMKAQKLDGLNWKTAMYWEAYKAAKGTREESSRYRALTAELGADDLSQNVAAPVMAAGVAAYAAPVGVALGGVYSMAHRYLERKDEGKPFTGDDLSGSAYGGAMTGAAFQTVFRMLPANLALVIGAGLGVSQVGTGINEMAHGYWRTGAFDMATGLLALKKSFGIADDMTRKPEAVASPRVEPVTAPDAAGPVPDFIVGPEGSSSTVNLKALFATTKWRAGTADTAWSDARPGSTEELRRCPTCSTEFPRYNPEGGQAFDINHRPTWRSRVLKWYQAWTKGQPLPSRKQVNDNYHEGIEAQCVNCNRGRSHDAN